MQKNQNGFGVVGILIIIVVLASIAGLGYLVKSRQNKAPTSPPAITSNKQVNNSKGSDSAANATYNISELKLSIVLTEETKDITHKISDANDHVVFFSLKSFLSEANAKKYPYETASGFRGKCDEIATIKIFNKQSDVESIENQVYGELLDDKGDPVSDEAVKLNDGRYVVVSGSQSTCGSGQGEGFDALSDREREVRKLLTSLLKTNLQSTD